MLPSLPATAAPSAGDTAWMLTSTALVLFMTIPGLALFYAGMVRVKNVLSVLMQCFAITGLVTLLWVFYGYSLAFGGEGSVWGGLGKVFLWGVGHDSVVGTIPETVYVMFQLTFAIITPTLIVGAFAERMKFSAMLWFMGAWFTLVYAPVAHWVWGEGGWLGARGILDFAGGTVVHVNAGIAGLVAALVLGRRRGYPTTPMPPHNLILTVMGASMLWVGWFGFNAGSALAADGTAGMAMLLTQIATAAAALAWMFSEWLTHGKPSVLGIVSGAVAGLVAVTPASGSVGPMGAAAIGLVAGVGCFFTATTVKRRLGYDDTLDVFGVHAMGGIIGALLTGLFCAASLGGTGFGAGVSGMGGQMVMQLLGVAVTLTYSGGMSLLILLIIRRLLGLRVSPDQELEGLDISLHDEKGYNL
ncbi:MAG: ammonium transporter [Gammaproteobacteria bacterium]